jgi:hypothetical protein
MIGRVAKIKMTFFIAVEGMSQAVRRGWQTAVMRIQCIYFASRGEVTGQNVFRR